MMGHAPTSTQCPRYPVATWAVLRTNSKGQRPLVYFPFSGVVEREGLMRNRGPARAAGAMSCLALAGCVTRSSDGVAVTVGYAWWLPLGIALAGLAAIPIGFLWRRKSARLGWVLMTFGPAGAIMFAPSLFLERTVVDATSVTVRSGIWGRTAGLDVDLQALQSIRIETEMTGGKGNRRIEVLVFVGKNFTSFRLPLNNDVKIEGAKEIVARAKQLRIPLLAP